MWSFVIGSWQRSLPQAPPPCLTTSPPGGLLPAQNQCEINAKSGTVTEDDALLSMQVAAGSSTGAITVFDATTRLLMAVQRFQVDFGPVDALAVCLPAEAARKVALAQGPRHLDGGGVVEPPAGLPWRLRDRLGASGDPGVKIPHVGHV
jgi:hypothetical protein